MMSGMVTKIGEVSEEVNCMGGGLGGAGGLEEGATRDVPLHVIAQ